jgi:hypothetical protein
MSSFSFGVKKAPKKKKKPGAFVQLEESQISENNPDLEKLIEANTEKERLKGEVEYQKSKMKDHNEIHTYTCLVFQSEAQKFEFLSHFPNVLCIDEVFIDGESFAEAIGKKLTPNKIPPIESPLNKKLSDLVKISE